MEYFLAKVVALGFIGNITVNLFALLGVSFHYYFRVRNNNVSPSLIGYFRHIFPVGLIRNKWTRQDIVYYGTSKILSSFVYPTTGFIAVYIASPIQTMLQYKFGGRQLFDVNWFTLPIFLILGLLMRDFVSFFLHVMQHRIPLLWEFHKVHHAPESLIPVTGHRIHPVEHLCNLLGDAVILGVIVGIFAWITHQNFDSLIIDAVGFYTLVNMLTFSPLTHSHIDLRLGWLEKIVLSPSHHHLHHSAEVHHWDKNFSAIFPFWDAIWSTLMAPPPIGSYRIGLPEGASSNYISLGDSYFTPFRAAAKKLRTDGWAAALRPGKLSKNGMPLQSNEVEIRSL